MATFKAVVNSAQGRVLSGLYPGDAEHQAGIYQDRQDCHQADGGQARQYQ